MKNFEEYIEWLERECGRPLTQAERKLLAEQKDSLPRHSDPISQISKEKLSHVREEIWDAIRPAPARIRSFRIYMAAAAFVGILVGGYLLFSNQPPGHNGQSGLAVVKPKEITPGHEGAVLTLADGTRVVLDSAADGNLAFQGNTSVIKNNGLISYSGIKHGTSPGAQQAIQQAIQQGSSQASTKETVYNTMVTPRGRQYRLVLPDGSEVWLNAASSLKFPVVFKGSSRTVELSGEAYFEVARKPGQPFIVKIREKGTEVEVLGTSFDIMAYADERHASTTLLSGSVNIRKEGEARLLVPGQQATVNNTSGRIQVVKADTANAIAWMKGQLSIETNDIQTLMHQISRWYDVDLRFEGNPPSRKLWGMLNRNADLSDVLASLESYGVHTKLDGRTIVILSD